MHAFSRKGQPHRRKLRLHGPPKVSVTYSFFYNPLKMYDPLLTCTLQERTGPNRGTGCSRPTPGIKYPLSVLSGRCFPFRLLDSPLPQLEKGLTFTSGCGSCPQWKRRVPAHSLVSPRFSIHGKYICGAPTMYTPFFFFFFFLRFLHFVCLERGREHKQGRGRARRGEQRIQNRLCAHSGKPDAGSELRNPEIDDHDLSPSQALHRLSRPGAPTRYILD